MSKKKTLLALAAVAAAPLIACSSAPTPEGSSSSSEALVWGGGWACAPGAQTELGPIGMWIDGVSGDVTPPGDTWYRTGETYNGAYHLYGAYNPATGNVDAVIWVADTDVCDFYWANHPTCQVDYCGTVGSSNAGGNGGTKAWKRLPYQCVTNANLATALADDKACSPSK
jgi:hypothetical protein